MTCNRTTERVDHPPRVLEAIDELMREKDAIENRTTELLRKLLDERGVEHEAYESEREKELEELVRDLLQLRCRQSCADCEHEDDEGCDFMTRALELGIEVY